MARRLRTGLLEEDYRRLARFRHALRGLLRFSDKAARRAGVSPAQYQILLFVRSFGPKPPAMAELAERLQVRHQSAVGLVDRCARAGLVRRLRDIVDGRRVRVTQTAAGARLVAHLAREHCREIAALRRAVPALMRLPPEKGIRRHG